MWPELIEEETNLRSGFSLVQSLSVKTTTLRTSFSK